MRSKVVCGLIIAAMVVSYTFLGYVPASAASGNEVKNPVNSASIGSYKEGEALVMYTTSKTLSKSRAKAKIQDEVSGLKNVTVEKTWGFKVDNDSESAGEIFASGVSKSGSQSTVSFALVKSNSLTTKELIKKLEKDSNVLVAEPDYKIHALDMDGEYYNDQWGLHSSDDNGISAKSEWGENNDKNTGSEDNVVAVVDTGVDYTHPDLKNNIWKNEYQPTLKGEHGYDFVNKEDSDPMDDNGHGTHCAGIIGAAGTSTSGVSGVNKNVKIMALKILDEEGSGYGDDEVSAYQYISKAIDNGVKVVSINDSWGGGGYSEIFEHLINILGEKGAVSVCAAGNEAANNDETENYPANYESEYRLSVAATKSNGKLVSFSNYGKNTVDLAAPGTDILSTVSYNCYLPSIYKDNTLSQDYRDFSSDEDLNGIVADGTSSGTSGGASGSTSGGTSKDASSNTSVITTEGTSGDASGITNEGTSGDMSGINNEGTSGDTSGINNEDTSGETSGITNEGASGGTSEGTTGDTSKVTVSRVNDPNHSFGKKNDGVLKLQYSGVKSGDIVCVRLPYTAANAENKEQHLSAMVQAAAPKSEEGAFFLVDVPKDTELSSEDDILNYSFAGYYIRGESDYWNHYETANDVKSGETSRDLVLAYKADSSKDCTVYVDDLGISNDVNPANFGKYDIYSGTSMATPMVTGAIALEAAAMEQKHETYDADAAISKVLSSVKTDNDLPVLTKGSLDFSRDAGSRIRLGDYSVDTVKNTITIKGAGLDASDLKVKFGDSGQEAEIVGTPSAKSVTVKNNGWINNVEAIKVSGTNNKGTAVSAEKNATYLVKGKTGYTEESDMESPEESVSLSTNGRTMYMASSSSDEIKAINPANKDAEIDTIAKIDNDTIEEYFSSYSKKSKYADYDFRFGRDLAYSNGILYNVAEYSEVGGTNGNKSDDLFSAGSTNDDSDSSDTPTGSAYSSEYQILAINAGNGSVGRISKPPKSLVDIDRLVDYSIAAYNGDLYIMGGFDYSTDSLSNKVFVYSTASKEWHKGNDMSSARAGGKAIQTGNTLVYTLGYSDDTKAAQGGEEAACPANLVFDGSKWTESNAVLKTFEAKKTVIRNDIKYNVFDYSIGACSDGIMYMGMPVKDYGDTFKYVASTDKYVGTEYNYFFTLPDEETFNGVIVGRSAFGLNEEGTIYSARDMTGSALYSAKVIKKKGSRGNVTGAGSYLPGSKVTYKIKAKKHHYIKSVTLNGKKIGIKKRARTKTVYIGAITKNYTLKVSFK